uniref:Synaptotagmin n=1 Tax=Adineta vaga TaxID=104782 RepID=B3G3Z1_ADIVA|nr:synaptotagmin [Adineta vaga]
MSFIAFEERKRTNTKNIFLSTSFLGKRYSLKNRIYLLLIPPFKMTRNNRAKFKDASSPTSPSMKDDFSDLPDLSTFRDEEKQHILDVLERDEHLRSRHLSRFTNLRKEVTDLEQLSQQVSASMCARCKTPFGYIFNTGDACPKCSAKVCKQCRLLYNANDNGWLCQLCCKQMQLMSYSGEWLYTMNNKFKKTSDDNKAESNLYAASAPNSIIESSSDSEPEIISTTVNPMNRFQQQIVPSKISKQKANNANSKTNKMIVQSEIDEQKLKFIRDHIKRRPVDASFTQPLPRRTLQLPSTSNTVFSSSEDVNPVSNQVQKPKKQDLLSPKKIDVVVVKPQSHENLKVETKDDEIDRKSIASSEWIDPSKKSKRHRLKLRPSRQQSTSKFKDFN